METFLSRSEKIIKTKYKDLSSYLNERTRRIWAATEAKNYGFGGIKIVSDATGIDAKTIRVGIKELQSTHRLTDDRIRKHGGGRKKITVNNPSIVTKLETLVDSTTRGDPESPLCWTSKSTYKLTDELVAQGNQISQKTVYNLLSNDLGYSLQSNKKTQEGEDHPHRNAQFEHINQKVKQFQEASHPVISVDTKKKENIGNYKNDGKEYSKKGSPTQVKTHDFPDKELGKVAPYGVYDVDKNIGWVNVGISKDTAEFAVQSIRTWWSKMGSPIYPKTKKLMITADCGGSNGNRVKLWKTQLQKLANETNLIIHVSHFPPGTSKWNKIEHKMFSFITQNWRGRPLTSRAAVINLISNTKTKKGLEIKAVLDEREYKTGIKISNKELKKVNLVRDKFHGEWNYEIHPNIAVK